MIDYVPPLSAYNPPSKLEKTFIVPVLADVDDALSGSKAAFLDINQSPVDKSKPQQNISPAVAPPVYSTDEALLLL